MNYDDLMRDAHNESLTASTRVRAAFDAIFVSSTRRGDISQALAALKLSADDAALVSRLCEWVLTTAPLPPLPMSPDEAAALAERIHKTLERDAC